MIPILLTVLFCGGMAGCSIRHLVVAKRRKKRHEALACAYQRLVLQHRVAVDHYEISGNRVFAFDRKNKKFLIVDHNGPKGQELCIPLLLVADTRVLEEKNENGFIEKILLQLKHKWSDVIYQVCFFDQACDDRIDLPGAARRAVIWKNRIDMHKYPGTISWGQEFVL